MFLTIEVIIVSSGVLKNAIASFAEEARLLFGFELLVGGDAYTYLVVYVYNLSTFSGFNKGVFVNGYDFLYVVKVDFLGLVG